MSCPSIPDLILVTSSPIKLREYKAFSTPGLTIMPGEDVREIMADADSIIAYKALSAGEGRLVEDTILIVDGQPWVDVKWKIPALLRGEVATGTPLTWQVRLGVLWKEHLYSFLGEVHGNVCPFTVDGGGMDPIFWIEDAQASLAQLDMIGRKDPYSARRIALENLINKVPHQVLSAPCLSPWTGDYQNE